MSDLVLPVLGLGAEDRSPVTITWKTGEVIYRGILGGFDPSEWREDEKAQRARDEEIRTLHENVVLLDDWRFKHGC